MHIEYSSDFIKHYKKLPVEIQLLAEKKMEIFKANPFDVSLRTHKLSGSLAGMWSFSVNYKYRILFSFVERDIAWFYLIGGHEVYK